MKVLVLRDDVIRARAIGIISALDLKSKIWEVAIGEHDPNKTREQEKKFHALCRDISLETGDTPADIKIMVKADVLGTERFERYGKTYERLVSTAELKKRPYCDLIEETYKWAAERGVVLG